MDLNPFYYLSTCALAEYQTRTKNFEMIHSRRFLVVKYIVNKFYNTAAWD